MPIENGLVPKPNINVNPPSNLVEFHKGSDRSPVSNKQAQKTLPKSMSMESVSQQSYQQQQGGQDYPYPSDDSDRVSRHDVSLIACKVRACNINLPYLNLRS